MNKAMVVLVWLEWPEKCFRINAEALSYLRELLREFRIKPMGISKYCIGTVLTNDKVKRNRFNNKFRRLTNKILNN
jgi:hypothetical protein